MSDPHLSRAMLLLQQSRYALAEAELKLALAEDPDRGRLHSFLAICLSERGVPDEAQAEADRGVALEPDFPPAHSIRAQVLRKRKRPDEALAALEECIRMDPEQPGPRALRGSIYLEQRRWTEALAEAEAGLVADAGDADCANVRAIALTQLGRRAEAAASLGEALERDPENDVTHANRGWGLLHEGEPRKAMEHFREALRLDPTNEWARAGIVEALKAGNPVYGLMLKYFLWMGRLSGKAQWAIVLGGFFGYRFLAGEAQRNPAARPILIPILVAYALFALFSWIASPLFNMFLRLHPLGKHALSDDQKRAGSWVSAFVALALGGALWWILDRGVVAGELALRLGLFLLPLSAVFACAPGPFRKIMGFTAVVLFALLAAPFVLAFGAFDMGARLGDAISSLSVAYYAGVLLASFAGNALAVASRR